MTDLRDRMRIYDQAPAPDYWNEVELRALSGSARTAAPARSARPLLLLAAAMLLALTVGGAALVVSRIVVPPVPPVPSLPPASSEFPLAYGLDGDIYLAELDGTNPMRIADGVPSGDATECEGSFYGFGPMWSPDGRYVAYRADHWGALGEPECSGTVYLSDAAGQPVASFPGTGWLVSWSPDSTRVATWVELSETIGIYGIDGARQALLTRPDECRVAGDYDPLWSPDGSSVVIPGHPQAGADEVGTDVPNPEACELPLDGSAPRVLPASDPRSRQLWSYSPDGASVAYVVEPAPDPYDGTAPPPDVSLVVAAVDGSNERVLMSTGVSPLGSPLLWSPTGDGIALTGGDVGVPKEVLLVDVASGTVTSVFSARRDDVLEVMAFSPDGSRVLFAVRDADYVAKGLWSVKVDGSDARLHVAGTDWGDWQPQPPGSELSATPVALPSPSASADPSATAVALPSSGEIASGTYFLVNSYQDDDPVRDCAAGCADYQRIILTLPAGWATSDGLIHKHLGEPREVAFSVWTVDEVYFDPCHWESSTGEPLDGEAIHTTGGDPHLGLNDQAALLNQVGRTASVPSTVTFAQGSEMWTDSVGALKIELTVDPELDLASCDQAEFRSWTEWDVPDGANSHHAPGQVDVLYLVDVDRRPFVIDASHMPSASDADLAELQAIIASMIVER